jgi:SAM-dependent methyltransferase
MATVLWGPDVARHYDRTTADRFAPEVLGHTVDVLADLAGGGRALELAIGTGRVALPLATRGVEVHGIDLSPDMVAELRAKPGGDELPVAIGDMATTRLDGEFALVYLVFNTIQNVTTQDEQVAVVANAAAHLSPGGVFVVEVGLPGILRHQPDDLGRVTAFEDGPESHVCIDTFRDPVAQETWSHHWWVIDGRPAHHAAPYRYVWPSELDLMARLAGLRLRHRWGGWDRRPFTDGCESQVVAYEKPPAPR